MCEEVETILFTKWSKYVMVSEGKIKHSQGMLKIDHIAAITCI